MEKHLNTARHLGTALGTPAATGGSRAQLANHSSNSHVPRTCSRGGITVSITPPFNSEPVIIETKADTSFNCVSLSRVDFTNSLYSSIMWRVVKIVIVSKLSYMTHPIVLNRLECRRDFFHERPVLRTKSVNGKMYGLLQSMVYHSHGL